MGSVPRCGRSGPRPVGSQECASGDDVSRGLRALPERVSGACGRSRGAVDDAAATDRLGKPAGADAFGVGDDDRGADLSGVLDAAPAGTMGWLCALRTARGAWAHREGQFRGGARRAGNRGPVDCGASARPADRGAGAEPRRRGLRRGGTGSLDVAQPGAGPGLCRQDGSRRAGRAVVAGGGPGARGGGGGDAAVPRAGAAGGRNLALRRGERRPDPSRPRPWSVSCGGSC